MSKAYFDEGKFLKAGFSLDMVQVIRQTFQGDFREQLFIRLKEYDDLADITANITDPDTEMLVKVDGQGLATYNGAAWVLASNDTTAIT